MEQKAALIVIENEAMQASTRIRELGAACGPSLFPHRTETLTITASDFAKETHREGL